jgi:5-formyltetrahydrofolate cyclo-ligase
MIPSELQKLRRQIRAKRQNLDKQVQRQVAKQVCHHFLTHSNLLHAQRIAAYFPADGELSPLPLLNRLQDLGKQIYLPKLPAFPSKMVFLPLTGNFSVNRYGLLEPVAAKSAIRLAHQLDLILLPLVAFDAQGHRLGMGGGYYDRALANLNRRTHLMRPKLLGLAHSFQQQKNLPRNPWDVPLHGVITEQNLCWFDPQTPDPARSLTNPNPIEYLPRDDFSV